MLTRPGSYVWDDRFLGYDFGPDHPFTERSRRLAVRLLRNSLDIQNGAEVGWEDHVPLASSEYLETFHRPEYLEFVRQASLQDRRGYLDRGDTPSFGGCYEASARIAAGAAWAVRTTLETHGPSFHPAGGFHHAHPERASGFCIFNDLALAIAEAVRLGRRVAYVDIDAHHGDGVMYGFYESGAVLDIDFHQDGRTLFPGTGFPDEVGRGDGAGWKVNAPLPPGAGDETFLPLFRRLVPPLVREFRPDLIVLQHGVDGHVGDPLARLAYTSRSYDAVDRIVLDLGRELCQSHVVVAGGGGYRPETVARVLARAGLAALGRDLPNGDDALPADWAREFEREFGRTAPSTWCDAALGRTPQRETPTEEKLIASLERTLGRSFPRTEPS